MADTDIEWADKVWNFIIGCDRISPGCVNCYALRMANRLEQNPMAPAYSGIVKTIGKRSPHPEWTGVVRVIPEKLTDPLHWRKPRRVFVNSMSDLFHEGLADGDIEKAFAVMALCPQHTFQVLTKRAARMREWFERMGPFGMNVRGAAFRIAGKDPATRWPLPNVWLGVSAEDQRRADERIPHLLATPAAVRWISAEPLLGPLDILRDLAGAGARRVLANAGWRGTDAELPAHLRPGPALDWVVTVGCGEARDAARGSDRG